MLANPTPPWRGIDAAPYLQLSPDRDTETTGEHGSRASSLLRKAEQAQFHVDALALIRRLKVYADRSASPIAHELCVEATEFLAKHTRNAA
ncbi:hypothetical protein FQZ97_625510 [compost metagenome]